MTVRVSAPTEKVRAYSRVEKFQLMAQKEQCTATTGKMSSVWNYIDNYK